MRVDLVRHGETKMPGVLLGRTEAELSDAGWWQFERQTENLRFDAIVASPRMRARLPAEALAAARGVTLSLDEGWSEMDFGAWDGREVAELNADATTAAALMAMYQSADSDGPPGGETWRGVQMRVGRAIDRLFALGADSQVLVSTHAGAIRAALASACGMPFASLWAFRIGYGTRVTLQLGRHDDGNVWGEIIEVVQP